MTPILFTIGYEDHAAPKSLIETIRMAGVELLLDVRELPMSRRRGFSKTALAGSVNGAGLEYGHDRSLGNPFRDLYRQGRQAEGERRYRAHLRNGSSETVDRLADVVRERTVCVLCFEADHEACHRAILVDELRRRLPRLRVNHL